ncbi:hypothetical protein RAS1_22560 [Phycisphaerae bacterium RAS1]|nr:hypothetical protein RAS1_22560 [Phycisphaerae bacterium RAS1]
MVEIISRRRARKDVNRNRHLYWAATGIAEYWIIDPRKDRGAPMLHALVREAGLHEWAEYVVPFGETWNSASIEGLAVNLRELRDP